MSKSQTIFALIVLVTGAVFIGIGTNVFVGVGAFFFMYALIGTIDANG